MERAEGLALGALWVVSARPILACYYAIFASEVPLWPACRSSRVMGV